jgi:outer membrane protein OmpA-like peptidoglycan-associated protein
MRRLTAFALLLGLGACAAPSPPAPAPLQKFVVFFSEWSASLDPPAVGVVAAAADAARQMPNAVVTVIGYADPAGSTQANLYMSRTRAQVVTDQLVQDGIAAARIQHTGRGPTDFTSSSLESRRVEIDVGG